MESAMAQIDVPRASSKINGLTNTSVLLNRNEPISIQENGHENDDIRLACQILFSTDLAGSALEIIGV